MNEKFVLAFDFGASSGRAMIGEFDGKRITLHEVHRFSNDAVVLGNTLYWDILRQIFEIKQGLVKAKNFGEFSSIGIDTWGVDFGLLDEFGILLENPIHYRDERTVGMQNEVFENISRETLYNITGIQFMDINTIFQLRSLVLNRPNVLNRAKTLLFMPDLMNYFLTGVKSCEYTNASTSQLLDANARCFSDEIMNALSIPKTLFPKIVQSGTIIGMLSDSICNELSMPKVPVVSVASHDTASAVASVPSDEKDFIYISCGTWSLLGTELSHPIIDELSRVHNITNEGGAAGRITFLKNIIGLWLIQESRRQWIREGCEYSYAQLEQMAIASKPFACFIDPDSPEFSPQGDIPKRVREFCERTGQYVPKTVGEIMRCIYESLALKYRYAYNDIKACTKREYSTIHIVGGGVKDRLLCQMTADSCGMKVLAGPIEATVYGNVITQLMASGDIASLEEARQIIKNSEDVKVYEQNEHDNWSNAYVNFIKILHS